MLELWSSLLLHAHEVHANAPWQPDSALGVDAFRAGAAARLATALPPQKNRWLRAPVTEDRVRLHFIVNFGVQAPRRMSSLQGMCSRSVQSTTTVYTS